MNGKREKEAGWNPWHGCHKLSPGCMNCYVYRMDARHERDASIVKKTGDFTLPMRHARGGEYKLQPGTMVYTCFTSDFLLEDADAWRPEAWAMMRARADLVFLFITKRIDRFAEALPPDWGDGYPNVVVGCTVENQAMAEYRLPIFRDAPIRHKFLACEPLLDRSCAAFGAVGGAGNCRRRIGQHSASMRLCVAFGAARPMRCSGDCVPL